jgi:hypothetical protein
MHLSPLTLKHKSYLMIKRSLSLLSTTPSDRSLQKPTYSEAQKLPNGKAIATLVKLQRSDHPCKSFTRKLLNEKAIAILQKLHKVSNRSLQKPSDLKDKSYPMIK